MPTRNRTSTRRVSGGSGNGPVVKRNMLMTIKSSGGVTRAVNGVNAPEPSTLRACHNNVALSEVKLPRRPPPSKDLRDALKEARRELLGIPPESDDDESVTENSEDASPRVRRMTVLPVPRTLVGTSDGADTRRTGSVINGPTPPALLATWRSVATSPPVPKYTVLSRKTPAFTGTPADVAASFPAPRTWRLPVATLSRQSSNASSLSDSSISNVSSSPSSNARRDASTSNDISAWSRDSTMFRYTHANPPPTCPHCNVLFVTFACSPCGHADSCFACAFLLFSSFVTRSLIRSSFFFMNIYTQVLTYRAGVPCAVRIQNLEHVLQP